MMSNIEVVHNNRGKPLKYQSLPELQLMIDSYFEDCKVNDDPITITGLAIWLGTTRQTLCDYQEKDIYADTIKQAKQKCEHYAEKQIFKAKNPAGAIFALKNYGWSDKQEIDHTVTQKIITVDMIGSIDD